ncbi:Uncharacterized protein PBTT_06386 [Plasmodiophora brassicae]
MPLRPAAAVILDVRGRARGDPIADAAFCRAFVHNARVAIDAALQADCLACAWGEGAAAAAAPIGPSLSLLTCRFDGPSRPALSPPYTLRQAQEVLESVSTSASLPSKKNASFEKSNVAVFREVVQLRHSLSRTLDLGMVLFLSPFVTRPSFLSAAVLEMLAELRDKAVSVLLVACVPDDLFIGTLPQVARLRATLSCDLANLDVVCIRNHASKVKLVLDRLAADVLAQRSVPLEIAFPHGAADRPLFVAARPFWQTLHVPQRARLCRCHQRDALVCASLRTLPCLQSPTARAVRIGTRAHVVSDDAAGHSIASSPTEDYRHRATIVGYVSLRGLHPAVMAGEAPLLVTAQTDTLGRAFDVTEADTCRWESLLTWLHRKRACLVILASGPIQENAPARTHTFGRLPEEVRLLLPISDPLSSTGTRCRFALSKRVVAVEEMRRLPRGLLPGSISGHVDASEFGALLAQVPVRANVAADELLSAGLRGYVDSLIRDNTPATHDEPKPVVLTRRRTPSTSQTARNQARMRLIPPRKRSRSSTCTSTFPSAQR